MGTGFKRMRLSRQALLQGLCMGVVVSAGLLLWARLKLVTNTPRMVYADPNATSTDEPNDLLETMRTSAPTKLEDGIASQPAADE